MEFEKQTGAGEADVRIVRSLQWSPGLNPTVLHKSMMVNFMCQLDWAKRCPDCW